MIFPYYIASNHVIMDYPGQPGDCAPPRGVRKVRTPSSTMPDNVRGGEICRIGPQKHTAPSGVRVKWWCKRPPAQAVMPAAGQPPSGARPNRNELLREGKLLVSLEFQVGCTRRIEKYAPDR